MLKPRWPLTRAERRQVKKLVDKFFAKMQRHALYHKNTGEKVYTAKDLARELGLTEAEYYAALAMTGDLHTIKTVDIREFARAC